MGHPLRYSLNLYLFLYYHDLYSLLSLYLYLLYLLSDDSLLEHLL